MLKPRDIVFWSEVSFYMSVLKLLFFDLVSSGQQHSLFQCLFTHWAPQTFLDSNVLTVNFVVYLIKTLKLKVTCVFAACKSHVLATSPLSLGCCWMRTLPYICPASLPWNIQPVRSFSYRIQNKRLKRLLLLQDFICVAPCRSNLGLSNQ